MQTNRNNPIDRKIASKGAPGSNPTNAATSYESNSPSIRPRTNQSSMGCHYEPIYRRQGTHFVPAGHKAVVFLRQKELGAYGDRFDPNDDCLSNLERLNLSGVPQFEVLKSQLQNFLSQKKLQPNQKMVFELDSADLAKNPFTMCEFANLLDSDSSNSLKADDIVIELSCASDIDRGDLYSVTYQLKQMGVMIALTDQDADAFSYSKIVEVKPDIVKFSRSWCEYDLNDASYLRMVKDIVRNLNSDGMFTGLTGVRGFREFKFAADCGFTRCQGRYFGIPSSEMEVGEPFTIPN